MNVTLLMVPINRLKQIALLIVCLLLFSAGIAAGEELLYAIRYEGLRRDPDVVNTKIYSYDPQRQENRLIFSDENATFRFFPKWSDPRGYNGEVMASGKDKIFAYVEEKGRSLYADSGRPYKGSIYELSINGTNSFRKIFDVEGEQELQKIFVNSSGTRIGYINYTFDKDNKTFIFIHETDTGKLLHKIDVSSTFLDCFASSIGWLHDGKRFFFTLDTGDVHTTSEESYKRVGTYFMDEDGTHKVRLTQKGFSLPVTKGYDSVSSSVPQFIGELSGKTYLFSDPQWGRGLHVKSASSFIYKVTSTAKAPKAVPLQVTDNLHIFKVSHTGRYMAFIENIDSRDGSYQWVNNLWIKDLASGEENKAFILNNMPFRGYYMGLVGWLGN